MLDLTPYADSIESLGHALAGAIVGLSTGLIIKTKFWWNSKTTKQKKVVLDDVYHAIEDGTVTLGELKELLDKHVLVDESAPTEGTTD